MRAGIISVYVAALLTLTFNGLAQGKNFVDQPYVEVTGEADSLVMPNLIYLNITISENDGKNKIDVQELEGKMLETIRALGIDPEKKLTVSDLLSNF